MANVALDVIISERDGQNNTLDVSTCEANEALTPDPEDAAKDAYGNSVSRTSSHQFFLYLSLRLLFRFFRISNQTFTPIIRKRFEKDLKPANFSSLVNSDYVNLVSQLTFASNPRVSTLI